MATATVPLNSPPEPTTAPARGLLLPCPCCGEAEATVQLNLADGESFNCNDCNTDFTLADVRNFLARWTPVVAWLAAMPTSSTSPVEDN